MAATVTGTVTNKTTNKPDANDPVVLIALTQNMQEVARTRTDASGRYRINLPDGDMHLIRVDHQKAAYFAAVKPSATRVDITVYDVSPKVEAVAMEADMVRMETDDRGLHVIESYFVKNNSAPPRTQFGPNAFEIDLPAGASLDASIAMGPGGMPVSSPPVPSSQPGHYAFLFPVRPGETRFQVEYHVPYHGSIPMHPKVSIPTGNYAVVLPKTMHLQPDAGALFQPIQGDTNTQSLLAKNLVPGAAINFTITGSGTLPRDSPSAGARGDQASGNAASSTSETSSSHEVNAPTNSPDPLDRYKWWILSGIIAVLAVAAAFLMRPKSAIIPNATPVPEGASPGVDPSSQSFWLAALKQELFTLETDRLAGRISEEEYAQQKSAMEIVMQRALRRRA